MTAYPCMVCGAGLALREGRAFCSNDACPSGGLFLRCGYCRSYSFSIHPEQMSCANSKCRMHEIKRSFCQSCNKTSRIPHEGRTVCINRNCGTNKEVIDSCFFCGKRSFLRSPDLMFCTKGDCPYLLGRMEVCPHCEKTAHEEEEGRCRNDRCTYHDVQIEPCPSCTFLSLIREEGHEHAGKCVNADCDLYHGAVAEAPSTLGLEPAAPTVKADDETDDDLRIEKREKVLAAETELDVAPRETDEPEPEREVPPPPPEPSAFPERHPGDDFSIPLPKALTKPKEPPTRVSPSGRLRAAPKEEEAPPMAPPPPPAAPAAPAPPEADAGESLRAAFRFVSERILVDENGVSYPLYPVIGLARSGKTTYLSMLGDILANRGFRYHFPWKGVDVKRVDVDRILEERGEEEGDPASSDLKPLVRDLAYDFAPEQITSFVAKGQWAAPSWSPQFLLAQVARRGRVIAQVISLEAGGEEFDAALRGIRDRVGGKGGSSPVQEAIAELLHRADGIVILLDPANEENADAYLDFFRVLGEAVAPRAYRRFRKEVKRHLGPTRGGSPKDKDLDDVLSDLLREGAAGGSVTSGDETMLVQDEKAELRRRVSEVLDQVRGDLALDPHLSLLTEGGIGSPGGEPPFEGLRHVAIVITKGDMYPIISPPDHYPDQKLQKCRPGIAALDGYLRLCGGGVRFYNASATGYSILRDTLYTPGRENTLTPINVVEPLLDMLDV